MSEPKGEETLVIVQPCVLLIMIMSTKSLDRHRLKILEAMMGVG